MRLFNDESQAYQELRNGNVHAVVGPAYEALQYPDTVFLPLSAPFTRESIGFAVRKGDFDILTFFNSWIPWSRMRDGWKSVINTGLGPEIGHLWLNSCSQLTLKK